MTMSTPETESLFSLELIVEKLFIPKTICRFPAIAFRLLDFPTLIIYHVEHDLAERIRGKVAEDAGLKLPSQLNELKDKQGNFQFRKGKSCLFKVSGDTLMMHLFNTPLYVMVIDTYPEVPKLLGSCTIPLDKAMESVYSDISEFGLAVPAVHGEKGLFNVFNLMGTNIGHVVLGYRLLSLGVGLIPHIPDNAINRVKPTGEPQMLERLNDIKSVDLAEGTTQTVDLIVQDLETADKDVQVAVSFPDKNIKSDENLQTVSTQTSKRLKSNVKKKQQLNTEVKVRDELDDFFISNTVCPPPLFYNSEAPEPFFEKQERFDVAEEVKLPHHVKFNGDTEESEEHFSDEESTIREEDKFSESDLQESFLHISESEVKNEKTAMRKKLTKSIIEPQERIEVKIADKKQQAFSSLLEHVGGGFADLPVLSALLSEIVALQNKGPSQARPKSPTQYDTPRAKSAVHSPARHENTEMFLARLSSPRHSVIPAPVDKRSHSIASAPPNLVPKTKGWIRREPQYGVRKTSLKSAMTNTQRLRLAKANPELLKTLEKEEQARKQQVKAKEVAKWGFRPSKRGIEKSEGQPVGDGKQRQQAGSSYTPRQYDPFARTETRDSTEVKVHRKPIPTPRKSLHGNQDVRVKALIDRNSQAFSELASGQQIDNQAEPELERYVDHYSDQSAQPTARSHKSIEVHMPNVSAQNEYDSHSETASEQSYTSAQSDEQFGKTRTLQVPGFPPDFATRESQESTTKYTENPDYSEDFENTNRSEGVDPGDDLGLKKYVDEYSDSDKSETPTYHSAKSGGSKGSKYSTKSANSGSVQSKPQPMPPPSVQSPVAMIPSTKTELEATRQPIAPSPPTPREPRPPASRDSTPRRPHVPLKRAVSAESNAAVDSDEERKTVPRRPRPSPRKVMDRKISIRTASVSSYNPSDPENLSDLSPLDSYSDAFDDDDDDEDYMPKPQSMSKLPKAASNLGYTWSG